MMIENNIASELYNELLKGGVIVRPMGPREVRVTIGLAGENKRFIEALGRVREAFGKNFLC